jgi:hypothetical protein
LGLRSHVDAIKWIENECSMSAYGGMKSFRGILPTTEVVQAHVFPMLPVVDSEEEEDAYDDEENTMMHRIRIEMEFLSSLECANLLRYVGIAHVDDEGESSPSLSSLRSSLIKSNEFVVVTSHDPEFIPLTATDPIIFQQWSWMQVFHLIHQIINGLHVLHEKKVDFKLFSPHSILYHPVDLRVMLSQYGDWITLVRSTFTGSSWKFPQFAPTFNHSMTIGMLLAFFMHLKCHGSVSCFDCEFTWESFKDWWDENCSIVDGKLKLPSIIDQTSLSSIPSAIQMLYQSCIVDSLCPTFLDGMQSILDNLALKMFPWEWPIEMRCSYMTKRIGTTAWSVLSDHMDHNWKYISERIMNFDVNSGTLSATECKILFPDKNVLINMKHRILMTWKDDDAMIAHDDRHDRLIEYDDDAATTKREGASHSSVGPRILSVGVCVNAEESMQLALEPAAWLHSHSLSVLSCRLDISTLVEDTFFERDEDEGKSKTLIDSCTTASSREPSPSTLLSMETSPPKDCNGQEFPFSIVIFWVLLMDIVPKGEETSAVIHLKLMEKSEDLLSEEPKRTISLSQVENLIPTCIVRKRT